MCDKEETTQDGRLCHCSCHNQTIGSSSITENLYSTRHILHLYMLDCWYVVECVCVCVHIKISKIKRRDTSSMLIVHSQSCMRCLILVSFSLSLSIHYGPNGWAFCLVRVASSIIHNTTTTTTREKNKN